MNGKVWLGEGVEWQEDERMNHEVKKQKSERGEDVEFPSGRGSKIDLKYNICGWVLFSKTRYVNHLKNQAAW